MLHQIATLKTILPRMAVSFLIAVGILLQASPVHADELTRRSILIARSNPSATTDYQLSYMYSQVVLTGSVLLEFCSNSPLFDLPCTTPAGIDTTGATLASQSGETGYSVNAATNGRLLLSRAPQIVSPVQSTYRFENIINPSNFGAVYIRVSTYQAANATGPVIDRGAVAYSIQPDVSVSAYVPPRLDFCFATSITTNNCSNPQGSFINLGNFSEQSTSVGQAQFAASTNSVTGYNVQMLGTTLTSGNNIIPALTSPSTSSRGTSQFGFNLRRNFTPNGGNEIIGAGTGVARPNYNQVDRFMFSSGDTIASSPLSTLFNTYTMTFATNVEENQAVGIYSTTITLIAFANF